MKSNWKEDLFFLGLKLAFVGLILTVMLLWVFGLARCTDNTMHPACKDGDLVLFDRTKQEYSERELVTLSVNGKTQIRRIIAVPGDTVDITEEGLFLNGYLQKETDITTNTQPYEEGIHYPVTLKKDEYFVLADYRTNAQDSRLYGVVTVNEILGTVFTLLRRRGF